MALSSLVNDGAIVCVVTMFSADQALVGDRVAVSLDGV